MDDLLRLESYGFSLSNDQMQMAIVGKIVANDLFVFVLQNSLFDAHDRAIRRNVRPTLTAMTHEQTLLFYHDGGARFVHLDVKIIFQIRRSDIIEHQLS